MTSTIGEDDFDDIWNRLRQQGRQWWADPHKRHPGEINHEDGGRELYWRGPDGHWLEIITCPYGSGGLTPAVSMATAVADQRAQSSPQSASAPAGTPRAEP